MQEFTANLKQSARVLRGAWRVTKQGASYRLSLGLLELFPQFLFYLAHAIVIFAMFHTVQGQVVARTELMVFLLMMFSVDSLGDALMFKGISEYLKSLRRGQTLYYLLSPGMPLLKVLFFRWDLPMVILGLGSGLSAVVLSAIKFGSSPLLTVICLAFGILTHIVLTSAFFIVQAYFDPTMPIAFGSPASRFYTKPMNLFFSGTVATGILISIYPAFFMTAFPAGLAVNHMVGVIPQHPVIAYAIGAVSVGVWMFVLNSLVKKSCKMRQN